MGAPTPPCLVSLTLGLGHSSQKIVMKNGVSLYGRSVWGLARPGFFQAIFMKTLVSSDDFFIVSLPGCAPPN
jgi:hypothetical protein